MVSFVGRDDGQKRLNSPYPSQPNLFFEVEGFDGVGNF
jgi:hypothetical protein